MLFKFVIVWKWFFCLFGLFGKVNFVIFLLKLLSLFFEIWINFYGFFILWFGVLVVLYIVL